MRGLCQQTETVAEFLTRAIKLSGKTQSEICADIGYSKPNIITMFKQGRTRVPLDKIGPLSRALGVDGRDFFVKVLGEYMPETLRAIKPFLSIESLTPEENFLIETYRMASEGKEQKFILFKPSWLKKALIKV
jgi:transcriptional regulator with XRE-family HTH domain